MKRSGEAEEASIFSMVEHNEWYEARYASGQAEYYKQKYYAAKRPEWEKSKQKQKQKKVALKESAALIGDTEQVRAILNKQQPLNLDAIQRLNQDFGISAEVLIKPYSLEKASA